MASGKSIALREFTIKARALQWAHRDQHPPQKDRGRSLRGKARRNQRKADQRAQKERRA